MRQVDETPKVPRVAGSGCHCTVLFALLFPKIWNVLTAVVVRASENLLNEVFLARGIPGEIESEVTS